ncbi:MAG: translation elongation factor 4 [Patescibacteria group bacterium]|nr:translation elongation factor 4 [Patescibacteria group bacterium]
MLDRIRNFAIIAHIDHGKSTLADRLLEITQTVPKEKLIPQYLDRLSLERERGITIKMQPVRMNYKGYILNLIDTPGHSDFSYEVSRALACVEGVILLIDGTQGIQAQTFYNLKLAQELNLKIIPVINKIDLPIIDLDDLIQDITKLVNCQEEDIYLISAKTGLGVEDVLRAVIDKIPPPFSKNNERSSQALIFDSHFDSYRGVIAHIRVFRGEFRAGKNYFLKSKKFSFKSIEVGIFNPERIPVEFLKEGEIGYLATGIKEYFDDKKEIISLLNIGETITENLSTEAIPGYYEPVHIVFANIYPSQETDYSKFKDSVFKLKLNDWSLKIEPTFSSIFGRGFTIGCLGLLHLEIFQERLKREFETEVIITSPSIKYEILLKNKQIIEIENVNQLPDPSKILEIREPWVEIEIFTQFNFIEVVSNLIKTKRGIIKDQKTLSSFLIIKAEIPLEELITGFYDDLKSLTSGYSSLNWHFLEFRPANLTKLDILVAEEIQPALSRLIIKEKSEEVGRKILLELKNLLPRQQFPVKLQAVIGGKIIARETIPALKKDVAGWLYGGDITRKIKLWQKQNKGKKKLTQLGRGKVKIPNDVIIKILKIK